jgi:Phage terminase large subunit (GpA)
MNQEDLYASSALAWITLNNTVTENQKSLEFSNHRFLIKPLNDQHPDQVYLKSAQVGMSVMSILKSIWAAQYLKANVGYVLPSQNIVKDFVTPKVDPLISSNPFISQLVSKDSVTLKQIGDRFVYFRGAFSEREAIAISLDILVLDELDRMTDMGVVNTYDSRMQASEIGWRWRLSNPSVPNYGVHELYLGGNQLHWFVKCTHCGHNWYLTMDESDEHNHFVDRERKIFACGKCRKEITNDARRDGEWVPKYPSRTNRNSYWMSQLMAPWVTAQRILDQQEESSVEFFHNFVLGLPYQAADLTIDRATIIAANTPKEPMLKNVVMGTDVGKPHWYWLGTPAGVFKCGKTTDWEELERLFNMYQCEAWVIDGMPEFTMVQSMIRKYPGKVFACYFARDTKQVGIIRWGEGDKRGIVSADRTKIIDRLVTEITTKDIKFLQKTQEIEEFISHASNMYRTVSTNDKGSVVVDWKTKDSRPDHLVFALVYWRIALEKAFGSMGGVVEMKGVDTKTPAPTVINNKISVQFNIEDSIERAKR